MSPKSKKTAASAGGKRTGEEKERIDPSKSKIPSSPSRYGEEEDEELRDAEEEDIRQSIDLPLDLWLLVAENLDPLSLLYLTRTTKTLYQTLLSKEHSRSIWKRSAKVLNLPSFQNKDLIGPALISFLYETRCHACGEDGAFELSYTLLMRWHAKSYCATHRTQGAGQSQTSCEDKIFLEKNDITVRIPAIRHEVFDCVPAAFKNQSALINSPFNYYDVARLREINFELLDAISACSKEEQESAVQSFVESKKQHVRDVNEDAIALQVWYNRSKAERKRSLKHEVTQRLKKQDEAQSIKAVFHQWVHVIDLPHAITNEERETLIPALALAVKAHYDAEVEEQRKKDRFARRLALKARFDKLIGQLALFPSFPIFTELDSVRDFWKINDKFKDGHELSTPGQFGKEWTRARSSIMKDVDRARRWIKLTLLRIAAVELSRISQPLPDHVLSELITSRDSRRPSRFAGISNYKNSTGLDVKDPAKISDSELARLLNLYPMQAFAFSDQDPGDYREALWSKFDEINEETYQGPLFPRFDAYWHQALLQVLAVVDLEDGPAKTTAKVLEELRPHFFCGICLGRQTKKKSKGDVTEGMLASEVLEHLKTTHPARRTDTPQNSLVLYNRPSAPRPAVPAVEETARGRRAAARLG